MTTFILTAVLSLAAADVRVATLGGGDLQGELVQLNADHLTLRTSDGESTVPLDEVVSVAVSELTGSPSAPPVWLQLTGGSRIALADFAMEADDVRATMAAPGRIELRRRALGTVRWLKDEDRSEAVQDWQTPTLERWNELRQEMVTADQIVIRREAADRPGEVTLRALRGVVHAVDENVVDFEFRGKRVDVTRQNKVSGLIYYQPPGEAAASEWCQVVDVAGSVLHVGHLLDATDQEGLLVDTVSGATIRLPWSSVRRIDFSRGKIVQLSDKEPETIQWTPLIGGGRSEELLSRLYAPRRDEGFDRQPLRLKIDGKERTFAKGLALHSRTEVAYRLNGDFRRFQAIVGIAPQLRSRGHVQLVIFGDKVAIFESQVDGGMEPLTLDVDITDVRRLTILVDYGDNLDVADHLFLCDCKVTK